jgi:HEAT repeats
MNNSDTLGNLVTDISKAVESFAEKDSTGKQALNQLANSDPAIFFAAGIRVVATAKPSEGSRYLILTLAKDKRLSIGMLDSNVCTCKEAVAVALAAAEAGAQLQSTFEMALNKALQGQANPHKTERILRLLEVLSVNSGQNSWNSFQVELMAYPDKIVRSKAALLIGRSTHNVPWIARRLLDRDPRVQASAVEALWGVNAEEAKPLFLSALKSPNNRVAANAALGLYFSGDVTAMRILLDMLRHTDPLFQLSALWAVGETRDERFLPALAGLYREATGKLHLATVGAMSRIRRRDKTPYEASVLRVHMSQAPSQVDGVRRLAFALSCEPARDLSGIKPRDFAVWENETLIEDYQVRPVSPPALLIVGFIAPRFTSDTLAPGDQAYEKAVRAGLKECLSLKRPNDLWRIDRYSVEMNATPAEKTAQDLIIPYDESLVTPELKASRGCISELDVLEQVLAAVVPKDRSASDPIAAFERQCDAFAKRGGKRHVFLFLHDMSGFDLKQDTAIERLRTLTQDSGAILHGICPEVAGQWTLLRELCLSNPDGSFTEVKLEGLVEGLVDAYVNLSGRFEISYSLPAAAELSGVVKLKIASALGQAEISLDLPPVRASNAPLAQPVPSPEAAAQPV